jgi:hypothetical protein
VNFIQKKLWITLSKFRFLRLPVEKRVRLEVTTDGRHLTFILVSLYEAGYGVQVFGGDWFFRELMLLRKTAPIPFLYGGKETECGISIRDNPEKAEHPRNSAEPKGETNVWPKEGNRSEAEQCGNAEKLKQSMAVAGNEEAEHLCDSGELMADGRKKTKRGAGSRELGVEFAERSTLDSGLSTLFVLDYDYFSGLPAEVGEESSAKPSTSHPSLATAPEVPMLDSRPSSLDSSSQAIRMPYFMQPGAYHEGFHKFDCKNPGSPRAIRLGFYGTHHPLYYTKHFRFPILPRTPILERFVEVFSEQFQRINGDNLNEIQARIAVSFDYSQSDQVNKSYLKRAEYFAALEKTDFMLCPPGWCMPPAHNLVESMSRGVIPILNYPEYMIPELEDGIDCLAFSTLEQMEAKIREALEMPLERITILRANVLRYYREFLAPGIWWGRMLQDSGKSCTILVNHEADSVAKRDPDFLVAAAEFIGRLPSS